MTKRPDVTPCWCDRAPTFDPDLEFVDEEGFVCARCGANVFYMLVTA